MSSLQPDKLSAIQKYKDKNLSTDADVVRFLNVFLTKNESMFQDKGDDGEDDSSKKTN